ncbi:alpha-L-fucosidase [Bacteroidales bacterium]|nr:alpha-L-fucosidase [Bacteroidales bacterium]
MSIQAQEGYVPTKENLEAREWFEDAGFGMFIHWGVSSTLCDGEWVMNSKKIKAKDYVRLINFFDPVDFDAATWVSMAKNAGMKYITFTTRHHDSFSNWNTQQSDWKITNTRYGKDVLKLLAEECKKQDIKLFCYYSTLDWMRPDYQWETGRTGQDAGREGKSDWNSYINFMKSQLTEILTQYGPIAGIWFDGHWDQTADKNRTDKTANVDWHYDDIYSLIHRLQPQCLIGNNHHLPPFAGEDFQMFERDLPGENSSGYSGQAVSKLPLETCETMNGSWGFNLKDDRYKSSSEMIHLLVRAAGYGANLLLNVGPMPNGKIQDEFASRLSEIGLWTQKYGHTVYGTRGGFLQPQTWGAITKKDNTYYIHILKKEGEQLQITLPAAVKTAKWLNVDGKLSWKQDKKTKETVFDLNGNMDQVSSIIELTLK